MRRALLVAMLASGVNPLHSQASVAPRRGLVISSTKSLTPGVYRVDAPESLDSAAIVIRGNDVTLDLAGVTLIGTDPDVAPDRCRGVAIFVDGGRNVTIRNGRIRGYKVAILSRGTRNLRVLDNDLSYNWKPRLYSLVEHESLADWLSFHHNENDEWLRYGAAIYLRDVHRGEIRGNTAAQGMNGLLLALTDSLLIWNNNFSFNSGLGVGMYRSSHNRVMHNRADFNVRGYSEGFYRRGQDSAGILIYEQSDSNLVAFNSVTHGGDGVFLWAGQQTMDSGLGGANDNLFYENDFSWAPANGIEATFSRNVFVRNRVVGSDYGLWGGYSYESVIAGNTFERNRVGIAIEHGQDNAIVRNRFDYDSTDIQLWANPIAPGDWGYPKRRDTRSRGYRIDNNILYGGRVGYRIESSEDVHLGANAAAADSLFVMKDTSHVFFDSVALATRPLDTIRVAPLEGGRRVLPSEFGIWRRSAIIVDEWGPYDWQSPKLWPADSSLATPLTLRVLTPILIGSWRVTQSRGAKVSRQRGVDGDSIVVTPDSGAIEDWTITLEYRGRPTLSPTGIRRGVNAPYAFSYSRFDPRLEWDVKVYAWSDSTHPLNAAQAFDSLLRGERGEPTLTLASRRLDYVWSRPTIEAWPREKAAVVATTRVALPPGSYTLRTISDDGIRVYVDDVRVIDDWTVHESRVIESPLAAGEHRVRVEYFQLDGWTELRAEIVKGADRSAPHSTRP